MKNSPASNPPIPSQQTTWLRDMYETRRRNLPAMGMRSLPAMLVATTFALALTSILLSLSWVQRSEIEYLRSSSVVRIMDDITWEVSMPGHPKQGMKFLDLATISVSDLGGQPYTLTANIPASLIDSVEQSTPDESIVLAIPAFSFRSAVLETTWTSTRHFVAGEYLSVAFLPIAANSNMQTVTLTITPTNNQKTILPSKVNQIPMFLSGQIRFQKFQDFLAGKRVGSGKQLADIGRIVLALFAVLLFVFIDSSPECLGLGMFMSLKALGVVASQRWYPDSMLPSWLIGVLPSFLLGFADFMQLYFFTQLARIYKPKPMVWLAAGAVFGVVYCYGANIRTIPGGVNWGQEVWRYRNILIGMGCIACSLPVSILCFRDKHYHRAAALLIASSGVLSQILTPMIVNIQGVTDMLWFKTWYNLLETHTPYVFALSTFINVSTLEKRVKTLTASAVQANMIEQEMLLGKVVQESFFRTPPMPIGVNLEISHKAEMYVSGDMIFSYHDQANKTATALICDVTGHGVQAALKASICSVICDSIWEVVSLRTGDLPQHRFEILHARATGFFAKCSTTSDLLAVVGCEVSLIDKKAYFYRSNAVFPMLISKSNGQHWTSKLITGQNASIHEVQLIGQSFIVMFSDGLMDSSRTYKRFSDWLIVRLNAEAALSAPQLKQIILSYGQWTETHDDQTLCILEVA